VAALAPLLNPGMRNLHTPGAMMRSACTLTTAQPVRPIPEPTFAKASRMNKSIPAQLFRAALAGLFAAVAAVAHAQPVPQPLQAVTPMLHVPEATTPIEVRQVRVDTQIVGAIAQTRIEIEFLNPNARDLEGELQFPLRAGQTVTGFALDIDGQLRAAVPVEKARGQQVFEDVMRARIDPALLQATEGNNYKLRVYPLPARGTRLVALDIAESLNTHQTDARTAYIFPMAFGSAVRQLDVTVRVASGHGAGGSVLASFGAIRMPATQQPDGSSVLRFSRAGYTGSDTLRIELPRGVAPQVLTQVFRGATYFYAEVPVSLAVRPRAAPRIVGIVWDASGSGAKRDHAREIELLDAFFKSVRNVDVELVVVRDAAEPVRRFPVAGGDWRTLREHLRGLAYDGATRLDLMAIPAAADLGLLFSDGLATYGDGGLPASRVPLFAVSSSASSDTVRLRHAAENSGGLLLDLAQVTPASAAAELRVQRTRLAAADAIGATEVVVDSHFAHAGRVRVAGRMNQPQATLVLEVEAADGSRTTRRVAVETSAVPAQAHGGLPVAAYRWAMLRLATLEADRERNREAIRRLGTHFSLVTSGTSLIVLDRVTDYVRHEIEPPPDLRTEYQRLMAQGGHRREADRAAHLERVVRRFQDRQAWWDNEFPKGEVPRPPAASIAESMARQRREAGQSERQPPASMAVPRMAPPPPSAPAPMAPPAAAAAAAAPRMMATGAPSSTIALKPWLPDSPYARRLRAAAPEQMYAIYLDERPSHVDSTAFFLDAADIFSERGQPELALRIVSNLAEMDLENRHILRVLAFRLLQAKQVALALPLLRKVLLLSPEEPQSYRDLGLALAADGQYQAAVERLWDVVARPWNERFPDIEMVALAELNAVRAHAAASGVTLHLPQQDARLLRNLPLDLRAVMSWDADNTDIDLHVTDPNGEEAYYGRQLTYQGGRMSRDFTSGYGPEEFALRHAKPGTYTVQARFYGHRQQIVSSATTLMLRLTTGFGTPAQKDHDVVLRLSGQADRQVLVGSFEVGGPAANATGAPR
jgi:hypothetical protein